MSNLHAYLGFALGMMESMETQQKEWKDRILAKWEDSKNYPRKKKKKVRKELLVDWAIASWDPFDGYKF